MPSTLALILAVSLAQADGGSEALREASGVYRVVSATQPDGGQLGSGWWLSPERMQTTGERLAGEPAVAQGGGWVFWTGAGLGVVLGTMFGVYAAEKISEFHR